MIRRRRRGERVEQVAVARTLCVLVRCGSIIVAVPASAVSRIALAAEVVETTARDGQSHVVVDNAEHRALHLGELLELELVTRAWLFVATGGAQPATVAIATGECVAVQQLAAPEPLPGTLFRRGADAIVGVFPLDASLRDKTGLAVGVWVDPVRLLRDAATEPRVVLS